MSAEVSGSCSLCSCNRAERAHFAALSLQQKIPFLARGSETGSMTAWGACSLVQIVSTTQSSQTARFQDDPHSGPFCGDLRLFISWILVSASLQAPERRFLVSRLRVPKFRSRRLGLEPASWDSRGSDCGFSTAVIRFIVQRSKRGRKMSRIERDDDSKISHPDLARQLTPRH